MHSPALIIVSAKIQDLMRDAYSARLVKQAKAARRGRIAGAMAGFRSLLDDAAPGPRLPQLNDYPYRS